MKVTAGRKFKLDFASLLRRGVALILSLALAFPPYVFNISILTVSPVHANGGTYSVDTTFGVVPDGQVYALAEDATHVYFGGEFSMIGKPKNSYAVLYNKITNQIENFVDIPNGVVHTAYPDGNGGWYIGGEFTKVGNQSIGNLAHIKPDRTVNTSWTPNPNGAVYSIYVDQDYVYVGGNFLQVGGEDIYYLARINRTTGLPDTTWNQMGKPDSYVRKIVRDGSALYIAGNFLNVGSYLRRGVAKLDLPTGVVIEVWNPGPTGTVYDIAVTDSYVYMVGVFTFIQGQERHYIGRTDKNTGLPDSWNPNPDANSIDGLVYRITPNPVAGEVYVSGWFSKINGKPGIPIIAKLDDTTGEASNSWLVNPEYPNGEINAIVVSGNTLYLGGKFTQINNTIADGTFRATAVDRTTATKLTSWTFNFSGNVNAIHEEGNYVFIGGEFLVGDGSRVGNVGRFQKSNGQFDITWKPITDGVVYTIAVDDTGVYLGGLFNYINNVGRNKLGKVSKVDGTVINGWDAGLWDAYNVDSISLSSSHLYASGYFYDSPVYARYSVSDGSPDYSWQGTISGTAFREILYSSAGVYIGGHFYHIGGEPRQRIARLGISSPPTADSWSANANNLVRAIATQGSNVFIGGDFTTIGGVERKRIAKVSVDGALDSSWQVDLNSSVYDLFATGTDIYAVGDFTAVNSDSMKRAVKISIATGEVDEAFNLGLDKLGRAVLASNNVVYVAGEFTSIKDNHDFKHLAKVIYTPPPPPPPPPPPSSSSPSVVSEPAKPSSSPSAPQCSSEKPRNIPDLFQIDVKDTTAKLYFTPADTNTYFVSFSEDSNAERHGALVTLKREGVQTYDIFFLQPNRTYYFKVRAQNGCMPGEWSGIMKVTTNRRNVKQVAKVYRYELRNGIKRIINNIQNTIRSVAARR